MPLRKVIKKIYLLFTIAMVEILDNANIEDSYWGWRDT